LRHGGSLQQETQLTQNQRPQQIPINLRGKQRMGPYLIPTSTLICECFHTTSQGILNRYTISHAVNSVNESKFMSKHEDKVMLDFIVTEGQLKPPEDFTSVC
jgi:hypothetical protein